MQALSINLATLNPLTPFGQAIDACARHGVGAVGVLRQQITGIGARQAAAMLRDLGLEVSSLVRAGPFTGVDGAGAVDDARRAIDEAAELDAACLIVLAGGLSAGSRDIAAARAMVLDAVAAILPDARASRVPLAIEPLHPMFAADRACVNTLGQALDMCEALGPGVGVIVDTYHTWWDTHLRDQIARAGSAGLILGYHVSDWLVPTRDMLLDRGMIGDGAIDLKTIGAWIEASGYRGFAEVEIFSAVDWWTRPADEVLRTCIDRFRSRC